MDAISKVMGEIPQSIQRHGTATEKLGAIWDAIGRDRDVCQSRLAIEIAKTWAEFHLSPNIPTHNEKQACERIRKMFCRESPLHFDFALEAFIPALPEPYQSAAVATIFPSRTARQMAEAEFCAWEANARADNITDRIRNDVVFHGLEKISIEQLKVIDRAYANEGDSIQAVRGVIRAQIEKLEGGARAPSKLEAVNR